MFSRLLSWQSSTLYRLLFLKLCYAGFLRKIIPLYHGLCRSVIVWRCLYLQRPCPSSCRPFSFSFFSVFLLFSGRFWVSTRQHQRLRLSPLLCLNGCVKSCRSVCSVCPKAGLSYTHTHTCRAEPRGKQWTWRCVRFRSGVSGGVHETITK